MTSRYRHRRTPLASTAFPSPIEPGEIVVNTANRQIAVGDASAGTLGQPKQLIAVRFFDTTSQYVVNDLVVQGGKVYRANGTIPPGAFNATNWTDVGGSAAAALVTFAPGGNVSSTNVQAAIAEVDAEKVAIAGDTMTGHLTLPKGPAAANAVRKDYVGGAIAPKADKTYVDAQDTALQTYVDNADALKAPLASPTFTGNPQAPTPPPGDADTSIATTAFVQNLANQLVAKSGDTMTGPLTLSNPASGGALTISGAGTASIEIGRIDGVASTPLIDFHSGAVATDYDARLFATGGNGASGNGILQVLAASFGGTALANAAEYISNSAPNKMLTPGAAWAAATAQGITDAATITLNLALGLDFAGGIGTGRTMGNPTGGKPGQKGVIFLIGGSITTWAANWKFPGAVKPVSTGGVDVVSYVVGGDGTSMYCTFSGNLG
jgi:hypothetical protein